MINSVTNNYVIILCVYMFSDFRCGFFQYLFVTRWHSLAAFVSLFYHLNISDCMKFCIIIFVPHLPQVMIRPRMTEEGEYIPLDMSDLALTIDYEQVEYTARLFPLIPITVRIIILYIEKQTEPRSIDLSPTFYSILQENVDAIGVKISAISVNEIRSLLDLDLKIFTEGLAFSLTFKPGLLYFCFHNMI